MWAFRLSFSSKPLVTIVITEFFLFFFRLSLFMFANLKGQLEEILPETALHPSIQVYHQLMQE